MTLSDWMNAVELTPQDRAELELLRTYLRFRKKIAKLSPKERKRIRKIATNNSEDELFKLRIGAFDAEDDRSVLFLTIAILCKQVATPKETPCRQSREKPSRSS